MEYFQKYSSNTYAGSGNQMHFGLPKGQVHTGRIFYKISVGGEYNYSLLFSNIIDSTYADGSFSHCNLICDGWEIHAAAIGRCKKFPTGVPNSEIPLADINVFDFTPITFGGSPKKSVMPGEFFCSDPVCRYFDSGDYLCLEITFSGEMIPYHEETLLPTFVKQGEGWEYSKQMPVAGMIGCDRPVKAKIAYLGDSITQGIGTAENSYLHWNALLSEKLGKEYSYWNLGLGYGRASDAATDGAWLYKALQNDIVFVCYGVNDILQDCSEEQIKNNLSLIVDRLKTHGKKVILQTVPPFSYEGEKLEMWKRINNYIKTELKSRVDALFDNVSILGDEATSATKFGPHPNAEGCKIWADALFRELKL